MGKFPADIPVMHGTFKKVMLLARKDKPPRAIHTELMTAPTNHFMQLVKAMDKNPDREVADHFPVYYGSYHNPELTTRHIIRSSEYLYSLPPKARFVGSKIKPNGDGSWSIPNSFRTYLQETGQHDSFIKALNILHDHMKQHNTPWDFDLHSENIRLRSTGKVVLNDPVKIADLK